MPFCLVLEMETHGLFIDPIMCRCDWHCKPILQAHQDAEEEAVMRMMEEE